MIFKLALYVMPKPEFGARTSIYLATAPEMENVSGKFFGNKKNEETPSQKYYSVENEQIVWDYCMETVKPYLN
ncbi:hypothetical protein [Flavobacterium sp. xlx-214]|nr:hypothetical protein [Flavobacterium sp. xlx-214]